MDSTKGKPTKFESVVSFSLLAVLLLIVVGIFIKQMPKTQKDMSLLLPYGFIKLSEETYLADTLYEKINGKAPLYIEAGFVKLSTTRFVNKADDSMWMELFIFDMASIKNAFSVYSVQRRPDVELLPDMQFGYRTTDAPYFVHGKYYIEFIASSKSDELFNAMLETVQKIQANLPIDVDTEIPEFNYFPQKYLVPGSHKLYLASTFGFEKLTDTFTAQYRSGDNTVTAFLSKRLSAADADALFKSYYKFLIENGGKEVQPGNNPNVKYVDFYGTTEIVTAADKFVFGIHEAEDLQFASDVEILFINNFREMGIIAKK